MPYLFVDQLDVQVPQLTATSDTGTGRIRRCSVSPASAGREVDLPAIDSESESTASGLMERPAAGRLAGGGVMPLQSTTGVWIRNGHVAQILALLHWCRAPAVDWRVRAAQGPRGRRWMCAGRPGRGRFRFRRCRRSQAALAPPSREPLRRAAGGQSAVVGAAIGADGHRGAAVVLGLAPAAAAAPVVRTAGRTRSPARRRASTEPERRPELALIGAVVGDGEMQIAVVERDNAEDDSPAPGRHARRLAAQRRAGQGSHLQEGRPQRGFWRCSARTPPPRRPPAVCRRLLSVFPDATVARRSRWPARSALYAPFVPRSTPKNGESDGL